MWRKTNDILIPDLRFSRRQTFKSRSSGLWHRLTTEKTPPSLTKHHVMKTYWRNGDTAPRSGNFTPIIRALGTDWIGDWLGHRLWLENDVLSPTSAVRIWSGRNFKPHNDEIWNNVTAFQINKSYHVNIFVIKVHEQFVCPSECALPQGPLHSVQMFSGDTTIPCM